VVQAVSIIGGGPAGLRAAEVAASHGAKVTVFEGANSVGRKFLVAGRNGLNLTNDAEFDRFLSMYVGANIPTELWQSIHRAFDNTALREWATGLGVDTFVAGSGKVLPVPVDGKLKATPLLRHWLDRLKALNVDIRTGHRLIGMDSERQLRFVHQGDTVRHQSDTVILALGGGSWPKTGSDASWVSVLSELGVRMTPLVSSNCGWEVDWPPALLEQAEGMPLKNLKLRVGELQRQGELVITSYGLEGGPIYRAGPTLRELSEPHITIDFKPDQTHDELLTRMGNVSRNFVREARRRLKLDPGTCALLKYLPNRGPWKTAEQLVTEVKSCRVDLIRPRPIAEAISTAGGIHWDELDSNLMLKRIPGVYAIGEMVDWDAPTGGFLLQACFAMGSYVGRACIRDSDTTGFVSS
jgi:uncharacterized flavoprotein (TIGR03862 family)